jgi:hypothetical protein
MPRVRRRAQILREQALSGSAHTSTNLILSYEGEHVLGLPRSF